MTTSAISRRPRTAERARSGFAGYTLVELLVVLMIIGALSGLGLGFLMKRESNLDREVSRLRDLARAARAQAQFTRSRAVVEITPAPWVKLEDESRKAVVFGQRVIGEWNFDRGRPDGSGGLGGELVGGRIGPGGRFGDALWIAGDSEGHGLRFDVRTLPTFDLAYGFLARCDVWLEADDPCVVVRIGESFELGIGTTGVPRGFVTLTRDDGSAGRRVMIQGGDRVRKRRWYRLELEAGSGELVLRLDGIAQAREPIDAPIWRDKTAWLVVSDGANPVLGAVDSVAIFGFDMDAEQAFDRLLDLSGPARLVFDESGALDRGVHAVLPIFRFKLGDQERDLIFDREGLTR
ncbi:MAG: prepilin-type N-terminal cleavage/methylation domain-containing protein [Planctomycetes bacterium]|nr:prepilin-type N-terminal cleavage/methylation domain-containing protein [Planctomycetota bacterium]